VSKRPRSQESKGLATRRSELLQDKPILPNTNVGSKLKEILSRQPAPSERAGTYIDTHPGSIYKTLFRQKNR
jgi:hypothetical protein